MLTDSPKVGRLVHLVELKCKDNASAKQCLHILSMHARPHAIGFNCQSYHFGLKVGTDDTVYIVEHWNDWDDLDALLQERVMPALAVYNKLLFQPFDFARDTTRIELMSL